MSTAALEPKPRDPSKLCTETRRNGDRCRSYAQPNGKCAGHNGLGAITSPAASQARAVASRLQTANEAQEAAELVVLTTKQAVIAEANELQADILAAYRDAIRKGDVKSIRRAAAADQFMSRVYGKPTDHVETTVVVPESLEAIRGLSVEQRAELLRGVAAGKRLQLVERAAEKPANSGHPPATATG